MKRNRFRLEAVMRVRRIQEEIERARMTVARADVARANELERRQTDRYRAIVAATTSEAGTATFLAERGRMDRFRQSVVTSHDDVIVAANELGLRRDDWSLAAQRVSALDRLHDRHQQLHHFETLADEVRETDERTTQRRLLSTRSTPAAPAAPVSPVSR